LEGWAFLQDAVADDGFVVGGILAVGELVGEHFLVETWEEDVYFDAHFGGVVEDLETDDACVAGYQAVMVSYTIPGQVYERLPLQISRLGSVLADAGGDDATTQAHGKHAGG
jgi:hypothetical protein